MATPSNSRGRAPRSIPNPVASSVDDTSKAILEGMKSAPTVEGYADEHAANLHSSNRNHFAEMDALGSHLQSVLDGLKLRTTNDDEDKVTAGKGATAEQKDQLYSVADRLLSAAAIHTQNGQDEHFSHQYTSIGQEVPRTTVSPSIYKTARALTSTPAPNEVVNPAKVNDAKTPEEHLTLAGNTLGQAAHVIKTIHDALGIPFHNHVGPFGTVGDVAQSITRHYSATNAGKTPEQRLNAATQLSRLGGQVREDERRQGLANFVQFGSTKNEEGVRPYNPGVAGDPRFARLRARLEEDRLYSTDYADHIKMDAAQQEQRDAEDRIANLTKDQESRRASWPTPSGESNRFASETSVQDHDTAYNNVVDVYNKVNAVADVANNNGVDLHPDVKKLLKKANMSLAAHKQRMSETNSPDAFKLANHINNAMAATHDAALRLQASGVKNDVLDSLVKSGSATSAAKNYENVVMQNSGAYQFGGNNVTGLSSMPWKRGPSGGFINLEGSRPGLREQEQQTALGNLASKAKNMHILEIPGNAEMVAHNLDTNTVHRIGSELPVGRYRVLAHASDSQMFSPRATDPVKIDANAAANKEAQAPHVESLDSFNKEFEKKAAAHNAENTARKKKGLDPLPLPDDMMAMAKLRGGLVAAAKARYVPVKKKEVPSAPAIFTPILGSGKAAPDENGHFTVTAPTTLHGLVLGGDFAQGHTGANKAIDVSAGPIQNTEVSGGRPQTYTTNIDDEGNVSTTSTEAGPMGMRVYTADQPRLHNYSLAGEDTSVFPVWGRESTTESGRRFGASAKAFQSRGRKKVEPFIPDTLDKAAEEIISKRSSEIESDSGLQRNDEGEMPVNTGASTQADNAGEMGRNAEQERSTDEKPATVESVDVTKKSRAAKLNGAFYGNE